MGGPTVSSSSNAKISYAEKYAERKDSAQRAQFAENTSPSHAAGMVIFRLEKHSIAYLLVGSARDLGNWTPPKGHRKTMNKKAAIKTYAETELEAALRETEEETGLAEPALQLLGRVHTVEYKLPKPTHNVPSGVKRTAFFLARLVQPDAQIAPRDDVDKYEWKQLADAKSMVNKNEMIHLLDRSHEMITRWSWILEGARASQFSWGY